MPTLEAIVVTEKLVQWAARPLLELALDQSERLAEEAGITLVDALSIQVMAANDVAERPQARILRLRQEARRQKAG